MKGWLRAGFPDGAGLGLFRSIFIKFIHTLIFLFFAGCIGWCTRPSPAGSPPLTRIAFSLVVLEAAIFVGNGWRCPLTRYAERLGAKNGSVADIFLPIWFAQRLPVISSLIFGLATLILLRLL